MVFSSTLEIWVKKGIALEAQKLSKERSKLDLMGPGDPRQDKRMGLSPWENPWSSRIAKMEDWPLTWEQMSSRPFRSHHYLSQEKVQKRPINLKENGKQHVSSMWHSFGTFASNHICEQPHLREGSPAQAGMFPAWGKYAGHASSNIHTPLRTHTSAHKAACVRNTYACADMHRCTSTTPRAHKRDPHATSVRPSCPQQATWVGSLFLSPFGLVFFFSQVL